MKDKHGIQRGRCNHGNCECEQYWPPPADSTAGKLCCEYCNHLPGKHLKIIPLGACSSCGQKDNCLQYEPEDDWNYSECQYCGCDAIHHDGADHLKKNLVSSASPSSPGATPSVKLDPKGEPLQTFNQGQCKRAGCQYPRRLDPSTGHVLEYCSRTCATNDSGDSAQAATHKGILTDMISAFQAMMGSSTKPVPGTGSVPQAKTCERCQHNPANPGRKWCQKCFISSSSTTCSSGGGM